MQYRAWALVASTTSVFVPTQTHCMCRCMDGAFWRQRITRLFGKRSGSARTRNIARGNDEPARAHNHLCHHVRKYSVREPRLAKPRAPQLLRVAAHAAQANTVRKARTALGSSPVGIDYKVLAAAAAMVSISRLPKFPLHESPVTPWGHLVGEP